MARDLLPPDGYYYLSVDVMFNRGLSSVVRDTYATLRALAWGSNETPELSWDQIKEYTDKDRATVYRHMLTLVTIGVIHWRPASVRTIIVTFTDGLSQKRDKPFKNLSSDLTQESPKKERPKTSSKTASLKNETAPGKSTTGEIKAEYERVVGYSVDDWAEGESTAAQKIAQRYTPGELAEVYEYYKAQTFWLDKRLRLRNLTTMMPEYFTAKAAGRTSKNSGAPNGHSQKSAPTARRRGGQGVPAKGRPGPAHPYRVDTEPLDEP